jgi:hypothetical protein
MVVEGWISFMGDLTIGDIRAFLTGDAFMGDLTLGDIPAFTGDAFMGDPRVLLRLAAPEKKRRVFLLKKCKEPLTLGPWGV